MTAASPIDGLWSDGSFVYEIVGDRITEIDVDDPSDRVEGTLSVGDGVLIMAFEGDEESYAFVMSSDRLTLIDEDGDQEVYFRVNSIADAANPENPGLEAEQEPTLMGSHQRERPAQPPAGPGPEANAQIDSRLVGSWSRTDTMTTNGFAMATQYHLDVAADGRMQESIGRTAGGGSLGAIEAGPSEAPSVAYWRTDGNTVYASLNAPGPWLPFARYQVDATRLLLQFADGTQQLWYRRQ